MLAVASGNCGSNGTGTSGTIRRDKLIIVLIVLSLESGGKQPQTASAIMLFLPDSWPLMSPALSSMWPLVSVSVSQSRTLAAN